MSEDRLEALRESMEERELDGLVVVKRENVRYLSGFTGDSGVLVVAPGKASLITDGRFREQAEREVSGLSVLIYEKRIEDAIVESLEGSSKTGIENTATLAFHARLLGALEAGGGLKTSRDLSPAESIVERLRTHKDPSEIAAIRSAAECARQAWESLMPMVQPGVTERKLAAGLDYRMIMAGADGPAFDTLVASGPNASMPHAVITDRVLAEGDQVVVDFGAVKEGYCCDVTRTIAIGEPSSRAAEIARVVRDAFDAAIGALAVGVRAVDVDAASRSVLEEAGLAEHFMHGLGHGVGLEVHEKPTVSRLSEDILEPGMVFTVEPGVYLEGETGARHEETVLLGEWGPEILTGTIGV